MPSRPRRVRNPAAVGLLALLGCGSPATPARPDVGAPPLVDTEAFQQKAHAAAMERLKPLATEALAADDPIAAAQLGLDGLRPLPTAAERAEVDAARERAWREAADIDGKWLPPEVGAELRVVRFALMRIAARRRHDAERSDPNWDVDRLHDFLDELAHRRATAACSECSTALAALVPAIEAALTDLGAASPTGATAVVASVRRLIDRLDRAGATADAGDGRIDVGPAKTAAASLLDRAQTLERALRGPKPARPGAEAPDRAPELLGASSLRRVLEREEDVVDEPAVLFARVAATFEVLDRIAADHPVRPGRRAAAGGAACTTVERALATFFAAEPEAGSEKLDCAALQRWSATAGDDGEAWLDAIDFAIVEARLRARRSEAAAPIGLVSGAFVPFGHRHATRLALLARLDRPEPLARALEQARLELCTAAAALWLHGDLGSEAELQGRVGSACPSKVAAKARVRARENPRRALRGIGITLVREPASVLTGLERYGFLPYGLLRRLTAPEPPPTPPPVGGAVQVELERLEPTTTGPER